MANKVGRPSKYNEEILELAREYLKTFAKRKEVIPTLEGLALYIKISRETVYAWRDEHKEFSDIVGEILAAQAFGLINGGLRGELNPTITKLILSGKHGYVEKSEQDLTTGGDKINFVNSVPRNENNKDT